DTIDFCNDIVVEHLKDDGHDKTEYRGQKGHLDVTGDQRGAKVTHSGNLLEGHDHPDYRSHEPKHGRSGDKKGQPGDVLFQLSHLDTPIGNNGLFGSLQAIGRPFKALVEDGSNGALGVPADLFGRFNTSGGQGILYFLLQFFGIGGGHVQIDDSLDGNGQAQDQTQ